MKTRRAFMSQLMGSMFSASFVQAIARAGVVEGNVRPVVDVWLTELDELCIALRNGAITQAGWQEQIDASLVRVARADLLRAIDYQRLTERVSFADHHEYQTRLHLPGGESLTFSPWFFAIDKGGAVVPHGHHNLVTMHMILNGTARGRQFERVHDEPEFMTIQPTIDAVLKPGAVSTISDEHNNVHWFAAIGGPVHTFNMQLVVDSSERVAGRDYVDPAHGEKLGSGLIRARRLEQQEAYQLYGRS